MAKTYIGLNRPNDGQEWDCQCARCGSSLQWIECQACGGEGTTAPGELFEQDSLWYDEDDVAVCDMCRGQGSWPACISSWEWCQGHTLPGKSEIPSGTPEWFVVPETKKTV